MKINDDILISYLHGELTAEEVRDIEEWLEKDTTHRQRYNQFRVLWETSLHLRFNEEIDVSASLERFKLKMGAHKSSEKNLTIAGRNHRWIKIAAVVFLISSVTWLFFNQFSIRQTELITQGSVITETLSDGSVITLNKNSLLLYPQKFRGKLRQVWLSRGEAFFNISPDRAKPFLIHAGKTVIKVVGTSFNVKNKRGLMEIIVETGIVLVSRNGQVISLRPGEKISVQSGDGKMVKEQIPDHLYSYYRSKKFVAEDTPLWRMVQVLNEAYDSHIVIGTKELRNLPLNTTFKDESLEDILQVICKTFKIKAEKRDNQIILY
jgi:transmembrane sensor